MEPVGGFRNGDVVPLAVPSPVRFSADGYGLAIAHVLSVVGAGHGAGHAVAALQIIHIQVERNIRIAVIGLSDRASDGGINGLLVQRDVSGPGLRVQVVVAAEGDGDLVCADGQFLFRSLVFQHIHAVPVLISGFGDDFAIIDQLHRVGLCAQGVDCGDVRRHFDCDGIAVGICFLHFHLQRTIALGDGASEIIQDARFVPLGVLSGGFHFDIPNGDVIPHVRLLKLAGGRDGDLVPRIYLISRSDAHGDRNARSLIVDLGNVGNLELDRLRGEGHIYGGALSGHAAVPAVLHGQGMLAQFKFLIAGAVGQGVGAGLVFLGGGKLHLAPFQHRLIGSGGQGVDSRGLSRGGRGELHHDGIAVGEAGGRRLSVALFIALDFAQIAPALGDRAGHIGRGRYLISSRVLAGYGQAAKVDGDSRPGFGGGVCRVGSGNIHLIAGQDRAFPKGQGNGGVLFPIVELGNFILHNSGDWLGVQGDRNIGGALFQITVSAVHNLQLDAVSGGDLLPGGLIGQIICAAILGYRFRVQHSFPIEKGNRFLFHRQRALRELQCHMGLGGLVKGLGDGSVHLGLYLLGIQRDGAGCAAFVQIIAAAVFHGEDLCLSGGLDPFLTCLVADGKAPVARNRYRIGELGAAQEQRRLIFSGRGQGVGLGRGAGSLDRPGDGDGVAVGKGRCLSASVGYFQCAEVCRAFMDGQCKSLLVLCSRPLGGR